jgi:hypothetical protein
MYGGLVAAMLAADLLALGRVARRSTASRARAVGTVGSLALVAQASGVYLTLMAMDSWLTSPGSGWLFWTCPALAAVVGCGLLAPTGRRALGLAVLVGSAQGFFAVIGFVMAAFAACNCWD